MTELTLIDYYIRGAMVGAGMLTFGALCWWMARIGRKRWSAEKRDDAPYTGHVPPRPIPPPRPLDADGSDFTYKA